MSKKGVYHNTVIEIDDGVCKALQATITVYDTGTTDLATIYSDENGTSKDNPFETDAYGVVNFYADSNIYDIKVSGTGISPRTLERVLITGYSLPPSGNHRVVNLYVKPQGEKLVAEWDDVPE